MLLPAAVPEFVIVDPLAKVNTPPAFNTKLVLVVTAPL